MSNIKIIYFDPENIDSSSLLQRLNTLCSSVYRVNNDILMVNYSELPKVLYDGLGSLIQGKNIFIIEVNTELNAYWGYMDKELWDWINNNRNL